MKRIAILGGGGFIGGHLSHRLKNEGHWIRICDIKRHEYWNHNEICDEFIIADLRDPKAVKIIIDDTIDEVYQLAAHMGGANFVFTGENDADIMHHSALINLNVIEQCRNSSVKKVFYSSSACIYSQHTQTDPNNPDCKESSVYPSDPDSEYGWEKLFSERLYLAYHRNYNINVRIARFHNIFGPKGTWNGGKEKFPAAICRKVLETSDNGELEIWGDGQQTRSFLYIDQCIEAVIRLMNSNFIGPVNIGSEEMISINELAKMTISLSGKNISIKNIEGKEFYDKYGYKCPVGVRGRNSNNDLYREKIGWEVQPNLIEEMKITYEWIQEQMEKDKIKQKERTRYIYESPDNGKTITRRECKN